MNNSTALGAEKVREIIFISNAHEKFYYEKLKEVRYQDECHKALCYCLGICNDTREHVRRIYDFKTGDIKTKCLREGWQTSGSVNVVRLAFNLYGKGMPSVSDYEDTEEQIDECGEYTVAKLFYCAYIIGLIKYFKPIVASFGIAWNTALLADMKIIYDGMNAKCSGGEDAWGK